MAKEDLPRVSGFELKDYTLKELAGKMEHLGFQATHLGHGIRIIKKMRKQKALTILTFTSNMVSSGLREVFAWIVKNKLVDLIITSVGSIEEDVMKTKKPFLLGDFSLDDAELNKKGINRIGNILVPSDRYCDFEDIIQPFFSKLLDRQLSTGKMISPSELIYELGKDLKDESSILYWASKNKIPIYCPAITDGAMGLQLYFFKQKHPTFGIDVTADMVEAGKRVLNADKVGAIILGGGIAKHQAIGMNILREGLDYAVYVTTATPGDGSLSGARPSEAKSWSKLKTDADNVCIEGEATLVVPLLFSAFLGE